MFYNPYQFRESEPPKLILVDLPTGTSNVSVNMIQNFLEEVKKPRQPKNKFFKQSFYDYGQYQQKNEEVKKSEDVVQHINKKSPEEIEKARKKALEYLKKKEEKKEKGRR